MGIQDMKNFTKQRMIFFNNRIPFFLVTDLCNIGKIRSGYEERRILVEAGGKIEWIAHE